jgi:BirA family biotin operon repressor/biotin-[acetyl-CoA-carboxylase] ligase
VSLGTPRAHHRLTDSTNARARELASAGAPHGTIVTAAEQSAGRGRQGRSWAGPPGRSLLLSVIVRTFDGLLPLRAGLAVADVAGAAARVKWPNDVLLDGRKIAGILVEGRPQEGWAVVGIGVNVAVDPAELPEDLRAIAGTLGRPRAALDATLAELLDALAIRLDEPAAVAVAGLRARDALLGRAITWPGGAGEGAGIDPDGRLLVRSADGRVHALDAGEVHLGTGAGSDPT